MATREQAGTRARQGLDSVMELEFVTSDPDIAAICMRAQYPDATGVQYRGQSYFVKEVRECGGSRWIVELSPKPPASPYG
jgi:hypothetical protein